jgi:peptidoglycan hydrolase-like protein with peptidoglycan-binding domain
MDTLDLRNAHNSVVRGRHVDNLQALLIATWAVIPAIHPFISGMVNGYGLPDGVAGSRTREALLAFQRHVGLSADAICGPNTWKRLIEF